MKHFDQFQKLVTKKVEIPTIVEEKDDDKEEDIKPRFLILSSKSEHSKEFHTAGRIKEECEKLGYEVYLFKVDDGYVSHIKGVRKFHNEDDKKGFEIGADTIAIVRGCVSEKDSWMDFVSILEKAGVTCVNSRLTLEKCVDKYRTTLRLAEYGLRQPKTILINNPDTAPELVANEGISYPLILKTLRGSKGVGVLFIESERSLNSIVQLLDKHYDRLDILVQEYIKTDYDVRVQILGGVIVGAIKRPVIEGDFRSNVSLGSKPEKIELTELEKEESLKAAKAVNGSWVAVDFIPGKNRDKDEPFFLEVNSSPGTEGFEDATKINLAKEVITHYAKEKNRTTVPSECGYIELLKIKPFGYFPAKFDTGNGGEAVIHAEKAEILADGKKIRWTLNGKTLTTDILGQKEVWVGGKADKRYLIELDVEFAGTTYKQINFTVDDRSDRSTPILLGRQFMRLLNVMVNPQRKYVVTTKLSLDD